VQFPEEQEASGIGKLALAFFQICLVEAFVIGIFLHS
jgi:hypothetical protein